MSETIMDTLGNSVAVFADRECRRIGIEIDNDAEITCARLTVEQAWRLVERIVDAASEAGR